jgi:AcrR family transcriptional regulator
MASSTATRHTQAERRAASRAKLLDAALECLAELGYAGTTFPEVLRRAGLSNGALWRHFRSKADLLVAAALHSEQALAEESRDLDVSGRSQGERLDIAVEFLWDYSNHPAFAALLELFPASKHDDDLREALVSTDRTAGELVFDTMGRLMGEDLAAHPMFRRNVRLLGLTMYGVAITRNLRSPEREAALPVELKEMARALFDLGPPE